MKDFQDIRMHILDSKILCFHFLWGIDVYGGIMLCKWTDVESFFCLLGIYNIKWDRRVDTDILKMNSKKEGDDRSLALSKICRYKEKSRWGKDFLRIFVCGRVIGWKDDERMSAQYAHKQTVDLFLDDSSASIGVRR